MENSEFKTAVLHLKTDLVSHPVRREEAGLVWFYGMSTIVGY